MPIRRASAIMMCAKSWQTPPRDLSASSIGESTRVSLRRVGEAERAAVLSRRMRVSGSASRCQAISLRKLAQQRRFAREVARLQACQARRGGERIELIPCRSGRLSGIDGTGATSTTASA